MAVKEYLRQAYRIDQRINSKLEQIASLRELASKTTNTLTDAPRNPSRNIQSMESIIAKMIDLENEINNDIDTLVDLKKEIVSTIKAVRQPEYQTILELRYLCYQTWEHIAAQMEYDLRYLYKLHSKALEEVQIIFEAGHEKAL